MKVYIAIPAFLPARAYGGPIRKLCGLVPELARLGVDVTVVTSTLGAPGQATLPKGPAVERQIAIHRLATPLAWRFSPWVWPPVDLPRPDVWHVLGAWNGLSYAAMATGLAQGVPCLWEPMGMLVAAGRWSRLKRWLTPAHQALAARVAGLIWTSPMEAAEAPLTPARSWIRPNPAPAAPPLEDRASARAALGLASAPQPIWGVLGRIDTRKGIDMMLRAWARSRPAGSLVFAGPAADVELARRVAQAGSNVRFVGALDETRAWAFLRAIDALLLTPPFGENFGNVVVEAVLAGTPSLISPAVGVGHWLRGRGATEIRSEDELAQWFARGVLPPAPGPLPAELAASAVARQQRSIYAEVAAII